MRKFILILLFLANIGYAQELPVMTKLPAKDKILWHKEIDDIDIDEITGQMTNYGKKVVFNYISNTKVPQGTYKGLKEDISKRTGNTQFFPNGKKITARCYAGTPFYREDKDWYSIETGYSKPDVFNAHIETNIWDWFVAVVYADTFFSGVGDGFCYLGTGADWDAVHDASASSNANYTSASWNEASTRGDTSPPRINRLFVPIDTSALPDNAIISAADLKLYCDTAVDDTHTSSCYTAVVETFQADPTQLVVADYEDCGSDNGTAGRAKEANIEEGSAQVDNDFIVANLNSYITWTLNVTGLGWISKTGYSMLGLREGHDLLDDPPIDRHLLSFRCSEYTGTGSDPYLDITYIPGGAPTPAGARPQIIMTGDD